MNDLPHISLKFCVMCVNHIFGKLTNFQGNQNSLHRVAIGSNLGTPNPHVEIHICYISVSAKFSRRIFVKTFAPIPLAMFCKRSDFD